jgi:hypothetical protein
LFTHPLGIPISRRKWLFLAGLASLTLAIVAAAAVFLLIARRNDQALVQEAIGAASDDIGQVLSSGPMQADLTGPRLDFSARLDGDVTVVAFTVTKRSDNSYRDVVLNGPTLGKVEPRERSTLPIKIATLGPGAEHEFELHYLGVTWLGDDVPVDRIDLGWATRPLDFSESWVVSPSAEGFGKNKGVKIKLSDMSLSNANTSVPVPLAEADARSLKARRDAALKSKPAPKEAKPVQTPVKS